MAKGKKTGGRKKGSITKDRQMLIDKCKELGVDVFEILLRFANNDWQGLGYKTENHVIGMTQRGDPIEVERISPELRQKSANDASRFMLPQLKAIDVTTDENSKDLNVTINLAGGHVAQGGSKPPGTDSTPA